MQIDGNEINVYFSFPKNKKGPGILVLHAWWGLNEFIQQFCDRLAKEGYFVMAPDYYNGEIATTIDGADKLAGALEDKKAHTLLSKAIDYLVEHKNCTGNKITIIGISLGSSQASWLANNNPNKISKIVGYYGTGPNEFDKTKATFLYHFAEDDPYEGKELVTVYLDSLKKAGVKYTEYTYPNTHHWFIESDRKEYYKEEASKLAWKRTLEFLKT